ncbi:hypothetical protein C0J52_27271 [Blattella germanica]|nr:hypothetical protein C0J52_27271 [Blattella germanica]
MHCPTDPNRQLDKKTDVTALRMIAETTALRAISTSSHASMGKLAIQHLIALISVNQSCTLCEPYTHNYFLEPLLAECSTLKRQCDALNFKVSYKPQRPTDPYLP